MTWPDTQCVTSSRSSVTLEVVTHPDRGLLAPCSGTIYVWSDGPAGYWEHTLVTHIDLVASFVSIFDTWPRTVARWSPDKPFETLTAYPLEGGFQISLVSTPEGPVVLAGLDDARQALTPLTTVPVTQDEIEHFVADLHATLGGTTLFARLGQTHPSADLVRSCRALSVAPNALTAYVSGLPVSIAADLSMSGVVGLATGLRALVDEPLPAGNTRVLLDRAGVRIQVRACEPEESPLPRTPTQPLLQFCVDSVPPGASPVPLWRFWARPCEVARSARSWRLRPAGADDEPPPHVTLWSAAMLSPH